MKGENLVLGTLKKADLEDSLLLRVYGIEGAPVESSVEFLGQPATFGEVNPLEEDSGKPLGGILR